VKTFHSYPHTTDTDPQWLMNSLGWFWNNMFKDKEALKGLQLAKAENTKQLYTRIAEQTANLGISNFQIRSTVRQFPLILQKSRFRKTPFVFGTNFSFGDSTKFGETTTGWEYPAPEGLTSFSYIANKLSNPTTVLVNRHHVGLNNSYLVFKTNPFENPTAFPAEAILDENGNVQKYIDEGTVEQEDSSVVVWLNMAKFDEQALQQAFGWMFDLDVSSTEHDRQKLEDLVKLNTTGPSKLGLLKVCCSLLELPICRQVEEVTQVSVQQLEDATFHIVVTDKNVYQFPIYYHVLPHVQVGAELQPGDPIVDSVQYHDLTSSGNWWLTKMSPKIDANGTEAAGVHKFYVKAGLLQPGFSKDLIFPNELLPVSMSSEGKVSFPVEGCEEDVEKFNTIISDSEAWKSKGLLPGGLILLNPLDFLFEEVLKTGTVLIRLNFHSLEQLSRFSQSYKELKELLPKNVWFYFLFDLRPSIEVLSLDHWTDTQIMSEAPHKDSTSLFYVSRPISILDSNIEVKSGTITTQVQPGLTTKDISSLVLMTF
jgi:hypothetical protein